MGAAAHLFMLRYTLKYCSAQENCAAFDCRLFSEPSSCSENKKAYFEIYLHNTQYSLDERRHFMKTIDRGRWEQSSSGLERAVLQQIFPIYLEIELL